MVKHIVFFKLSDGLTIEDKMAHLKKMEQIFSSLGSKFPFVIEYRTGVNFNHASHAWDFAIDSIFRNNEDLEKYMVSPEHLKAVRIASEIEKIKAVIDYEF